MMNSAPSTASAGVAATLALLAAAKSSAFFCVRFQTVRLNGGAARCLRHWRANRAKPKKGDASHSVGNRKRVHKA